MQLFQLKWKVEHWLKAKLFLVLLKIKEDLNIKEIPLKDIIFDQFFTNILPKSWDNTPCNTCARTCGNEYRTYRDRQQL